MVSFGWSEAIVLLLVGGMCSGVVVVLVAVTVIGSLRNRK
jgi:hypothetical protein